MIEIIGLLTQAVSGVLSYFNEVFVRVGMGYVFYGVVLIVCSYKFLVRPFIDSQRKGGGN